MAQILSTVLHISHIDLAISQSCLQICCESSIPPPPKSALYDWGDCGVHLNIIISVSRKKKQHTHKKQNSLRLFELSDITSCWSLSSAQVGVLHDAQLLPKAWSVPIKYRPHHYTISSSLNCWYNAGWIHAFMLFMPNSDITIWMSRLMRPGNVTDQTDILSKDQK